MIQLNSAVIAEPFNFRGSFSLKGQYNKAHLAVLDFGFDLETLALTCKFVLVQSTPDMDASYFTIDQ